MRKAANRTHQSPGPSRPQCRYGHPSKGRTPSPPAVSPGCHCQPLPLSLPRILGLSSFHIFPKRISRAKLTTRKVTLDHPASPRAPYNQPLPDPKQSFQALLPCFLLLISKTQFAGWVLTETRAICVRAEQCSAVTLGACTFLVSAKGGINQ